MKREELEAIGLIKEQIDKVLDKYHEEHDPVKKDLETAQKDLENEKEKTSMQETTIADLKKGTFFLDTYSTTKNVTKMSGIDYKGKLSHTDFTGGRIYNGEAAAALSILPTGRV